MSHSSLSQHSSTNPLGASNVSPLHPSGSTTMGGDLSTASEFIVDRRLYVLYEKLRTLNPSVLTMVNALNVALANQGEVIRTCADLEAFLVAVEVFETEEALS